MFFKIIHLLLFLHDVYYFIFISESLFGKDPDVAEDVCDSKVLFNRKKDELENLNPRVCLVI